MASTELDRLFSPRSIALIGASADPSKLAGRPRRYLEKHGYPGELYLVNPGREEIDGRPCYDSVTDVPGPVDLAMVLVPARIAPTAIEECGDAGVPFAVVIASGFAETGEEGAKLQARLSDAAAEGGVRVVGPNSQGVIDVTGGVAASFSSSLKREKLLSGNVSFVTQSGAFGGALLQLTQDLGVGTDKWISTGNEADLAALDFVEHLVEAPKTDVVVAYVEALAGGGRLASIGRRAAETDTAIVAMRVGSSARGREAAASHTASVATDDAVYDAAFRDAGVCRVRSVDGFVDAVTAFSRVPPARHPSVDADSGRGLAVVSVSGGAAVLIADTAERVGLPLAQLDPGTVETVDGIIPAYGSATNPVDVTGSVIGDPALFERCLRAIARDRAVEGLLLQFGNSGGETIEAVKGTLSAVMEAEGLAVATVFTGGRPREETRAELRDDGVLLFEDPVRAVETFGRLADRAAYRARPRPEPPARTTDDRRPLDTGDWEAVAGALSDAGVPFAPAIPVGSAEEAARAAAEVGYPVALKLDPLAVEHKVDVGGVRLGLEDGTSVREAYAELAGVRPDAGVLVQRMVEGVETIVGVVDDPDFGPTMLVGPGGVFVELLDDFAYRGLPVTRPAAEEMIEETVVGRLLDGYRGRPPGDRDALAALMAGVSEAYLTYDLSELECNPVIVTGEGAYAVDLLVG